MHTTEYLGSYWLLPSLNERRETLPPLPLWWCLLHSLSELARYHPAGWAAELDPNDSTSAVSIEQALSIALAVIPRLVLSTLVPNAYARTSTDTQLAAAAVGGIAGRRQIVA